MTLLTALFRTKLIAILIGPAGIGLMGLLNAFNANLWTVGAWGLNLSGVRMISSAPPEQRKTKEVAVRAMGRGLTFAGLILLILAVVPVGYMTFGSHEYSPLLFISGLAAPCMITSTASSVLLQSAGHIGSLARAQVTSGVIGFLLGIPAIYFFGELGIGISILLASAASAYATWKAARAYCPSGEAKANPDDIRELIKLGFALQLGGMLANASYYLTRILIIKHYPGDMQAGLDAAGYYQAAFALAGLMPGFIFSAMGAEFFPQVSAAASEHDARIITERQIRACLLLALPMLMAILTAGDWIMSLLYAQSFGKAVPLLPWFVWGIYGTLLSWPIVYWMMARGKKRNVIFIQTTAAILIGLTAAVLVPCFGIMGAAIGFCVSNTIYLCVMVVYARRQAGMWISNRTLRWFLFSGVSLGLGQLLDGLVSTVFLKLAPAFISTLICGAIYFKVMRSSEGKSQ